MSFRPASRPVKLPGGAVPPRVFRIQGYGDHSSYFDKEKDDIIDIVKNQYWYSLGPVMYNEGVLAPILKDRAERRRVKKEEDDWIDDFWPRQKPRIRLSYVTTIKENGVTYLIYRNRNVVRYIPKVFQPPKFLYISAQSALKHPKLLTDEDRPEYVFDKLGRFLLRNPDRMHALVDRPEPKEASMYVMPMRMPRVAADRGDLELSTADAVHEFESTRATPKFRLWFEGASDEVRNEDGSPKVFFRGQTSFESGLRSRLEMDSFTDSSEIATIYSSEGGEFKEGAGVLPVYVDVKNPMKVEWATMVILDYLSKLGWVDAPGSWRRMPNGITSEEMLEVIDFLNKRNKAFWQGGGGGGFGLPGVGLLRPKLPKSLQPFEGMPNFNYGARKESEIDDLYVRDLEDYEKIDDLAQGSMAELATGVSTLDKLHSRWAQNLDDPMYLFRLSMLVKFDTFALMETPTTKKVLKRLGYDGIIHRDVFGGASAAKKALGKEIEDIEGVDEGEEEYDFEDMASREAVYEHWTLRPLDRSQVWPILGDKPAAPMKMAARAIRAALRLLA